MWDIQFMNGEVSRGDTPTSCLRDVARQSPVTGSEWRMSHGAQAADCSSATKVTAVCNQAGQLAARPIEVNEWNNISYKRV